MIGWLACFSSGAGRVRVKVESMLDSWGRASQEESLRDFITVSGKLLLTEGECMKKPPVRWMTTSCIPSSPIHAVGHWDGSHLQKGASQYVAHDSVALLGTQSRAETQPQACRASRQAQSGTFVGALV